MASTARPGITRALGHRNYRLFFAGQSVSLVGTWITRIATSWLVYRLTGSVLLLGVVGFCGQIPTLVLAPFAGVLVDRQDRHRILVVTQALSAAQSAALAALALTGTITVAWVLALQVVQGIINAFDTPARQAFVVQMVEDRAHLPNAIALNSTMVNGSRIIGPSIGGAIIAAVGEGWCFAIDAVSYLAVIASLLAMRVERTAPSRATTSVWRIVFVAAISTMKPAPTIGRTASAIHVRRARANATSPTPNATVATLIARPRPTTDRRDAR
jgi:MFS family permease